MLSKPFVSSGLSQSDRIHPHVSGFSLLLKISFVVLPQSGRFGSRLFLLTAYPCRPVEAKLHTSFVGLSKHHFTRRQVMRKYTAFLVIGVVQTGSYITSGLARESITTVILNVIKSS